MDPNRYYTTFLEQSGTGSNDNEEVTPHSPEFQKWSLTTGHSLLSYPGQAFLKKFYHSVADTFGI